MDFDYETLRCVQVNYVQALRRGMTPALIEM